MALPKPVSRIRQISPGNESETCSLCCLWNKLWLKTITGKHAFELESQNFLQNNSKSLLNLKPFLMTSSFWTSLVKSCYDPSPMPDQLPGNSRQLLAFGKACHPNSCIKKKKASTGHLGFRIWKVLCVSSSCRVFPGLPSGADWSCFSPFPLILAGIRLASSRLTSLPEPRWATGMPRAESIDKHSMGISWVGRVGSQLLLLGFSSERWGPLLGHHCVISHRTDKAKPALEQNKITQPSPRQSFGNMKCDHRMRSKFDLKIN